MPTTETPMTQAQTDRRAWMGLLARSPAARVAALWQAVGREPAHRVVRAPEVGGVMVRGRTGAVGAAFNLGEMSVTRCAVRLGEGPVGHAHVQGRDREHARIAALIDAVMQTDGAAALEVAILTPLRREEAGRRADRAAKAAATKVDFFTMVRGEDA